MSNAREDVQAAVNHIIDNVNSTDQAIDLAQTLSLLGTIDPYCADVYAEGVQRLNNEWHFAPNQDVRELVESAQELAAAFAGLARGHN